MIAFFLRCLQPHAVLMLGLALFAIADRVLPSVQPVRPAAVRVLWLIVGLLALIAWVVQVAA